MTMTVHLDIVSAEEQIFSGKAEKVFVTGDLGELEVSYGHAPLLTRLVPGPVRLRMVGGKEEVVFVSGGFLEVQPKVATILADTVIRAKDFNEAEALKAKENAEHALKDKQASMDLAKARIELLRAAGMLQAIRQSKQGK